MSSIGNDISILYDSARLNIIYDLIKLVNYK